MLHLFSFITAMFVTMVMIPPLCKYAERFGFVDYPDERKVHQQLTPRIGGIAIIIGAVLPIILWLPLQPEVLALLAGIVTILFFGAWDDRVELDYKIKFSGQISAILIVMLFGGVLIKTIPYIPVDELPVYISFPLTFVVLLGITNAINLADGLDGLAGGITLLSLAGIGLFSFIGEDFGVLLIVMSIMGSILGFLRFNTHPARVFMGDTGSQFLGFAVGVLAITLTQKSDFLFSISIPVLLLGLPVLDTIMVMVERIREGVSPFVADKKHMHHKLLDHGLDHYEAVFVIYVLQSILVSLAYFFRFQSDALIIFSYLVFSLFIVISLSAGNKYSWKVNKSRKEGEDNPLISRIRYLNKNERVSQFLFMATVVVIGCYFIFVSAFVEEVPIDISVMSTIFVVILISLAFYLKGEKINIIERMAIYVCIAVIIYLSQELLGSGHELYQIYEKIFYLAIALLLFAALRLSHNKNFQFTTMDFLILFIAFTIPNIIDFQDKSDLGIIIAKVIIMFYGMEYVLANINQKWNLIRIIFITTFGILSTRILF